MDISGVEPLNLDGLIGRVRNRVAFVGVELEGAWRELPPNVAALAHDGSVFANRRPGVEFPHVGELPIGPVPPKDINDLMVANYPHRVNYTCGLHVHMSFETLRYYSLLMVPEYQETIVTYLQRWAVENNIKEDHCIWSRLRGESEFCQKAFWPDIQASTKNKDFHRNRPGHRYTIIHYCGRQNTIECRVLPMLQRVKLAISAVHQVIDITNACLYLLGRQEKGLRRKLQETVRMSKNITYEEFIEENL